MPRSTTLHRSIALLAAVMVYCSPLFAHTGASWNHGLLHGITAFFSAGVFLLNVVALCLLYYRHTRRTLIRGAAAFLLGLVISALFVRSSPLPALPSLSISALVLLLLGLMILSGRRFPAGLVILSSFLIGGLSNLESSVTDFASVAGFTLAAMAVFILTGFFIQFFSPRIRLIAVRVVGSWISAVALISIAYHFR